jgi:hypothetical protein
MGFDFRAGAPNSLHWPATHDLQFLESVDLAQLEVIPSLDEMKAELDAVLASSPIKRSPALAKFLLFICEEHFQGRSALLKEYTIAVEAFGRPESFQPKEDPIVRVDAIRLRKSLKAYYHNEGKDHRIQITLPKGHYVPEFRIVDKRATPEAAAKFLEATASENVSSGEGTQILETDRAASASTSPPVQNGRRALPLWRLAPVMLWVLVPILGVLSFLGWRLTSSQPRISRLSDHYLKFREEDRSDSAIPLPLSSGTDEVRILAGSTVPRYIDQLQRVWEGDRFFSGGKAEETLFEPTVRVEDRNLWRHYRDGDSFQYDIPLKPGVYELHLYFTEPVFGVDELRGGGETARIFDVSANGRPLLQGFDILGDAGGPRTTDIKVFTDISPGPDGFLRLRFASRVAGALVNALEIVPGVPGHIRPIRITTRNVPYLAKSQVLWEADRYYSGGRRQQVELPIAGTDDPELYSTERFGNFSYTVPVAPGRYTVIFHFSERYFGPANYGGGGGGSRVFDVDSNGVALLKDFDIYKEAGGANRALHKELHGVRPNALGKITLTFQPIRNYPCINALEIIPEGP